VQPIRHRAWLALAVATLAVGGMSLAIPARAASGCQVDYTISSQWSGGFGANVTITNLGDPINGWQLTWSFPAGQTITQLWNGKETQSGAQVTVTDAGYNAALGTGAGAGVGFNGTWTGSNPTPTGFALNGVACTGGGSGGTTTTTTPPPTTTTTTQNGTLPSTFQWTGTGPLISPKSDANHDLVAIKDPSVVFADGRWQVFASTVDVNGNYSMAYLNFTDWSQAGSAPQYYLDQTAIGKGYKTAPQIFYFAPQKLWYLVYQTGNNASYSTNPDISNPAGWSATKNFYPSMPAIISQNIGSGFWVDMWVICDSANCYLFSADDNGHLYRSQTSLAQFPSGFTNTVIAASDPTKFNFYEADNVYKVAGANQYLLVMEAIGSDGRRYFRSYTSPTIDGTWSPLAATQADPFAGEANVSFTGTQWTKDFSSGEMIRAGFDQTLTVSPCHLQYLQQGEDPSASGPYNSLPWRLGLLTQTNSTC
jgi:endo-1,4-beta-xylanase